MLIAHSRAKFRCVCFFLSYSTFWLNSIYEANDEHEIGECVCRLQSGWIFLMNEILDKHVLSICASVFKSIYYTVVAYTVHGTDNMPYFRFELFGKIDSGLVAIYLNANSKMDEPPKRPTILSRKPNKNRCKPISLANA